ncbi:MAG: hypothetical protein DRJ38_09080 [Thermoprotei archaeon]|nr:MAG: hypothetical protein DRJ38_09080 [Thermoprotei archaeon]
MVASNTRQSALEGSDRQTASMREKQKQRTRNPLTGTQNKWRSKKNNRVIMGRQKKKGEKMRRKSPQPKPKNKNREQLECIECRATKNTCRFFGCTERNTRATAFNKTRRNIGRK